jgi:multicomponent Na+:H+ antiporter subunit D
MIENLFIYAVMAPLLAALPVNLMARSYRPWAGPVAVASLIFSSVCSVFVLADVLKNGTIRYTLGNWPIPFGMELIVDPLGAMMLLVVAVGAMLSLTSAIRSVADEMPGREHLFFTLALIMVTGLMGLVVSADAFNIYVLLEITAITCYGLIAMGRGRAPLASFNYIIMGTIGACFYLLGVGYLYILTGSLNMPDIARIIPGLDAGAAVATSFAFLLVGLWIKMGFFPLHGWLPNAYTYAPSATSVLIAPLMTKVSVFLMIRVMFFLYSPEYAFFQHPDVQQLIVWAAALAIIVASAFALAQTELKKMLTYVVVAEVGYMVGGVWLANANGLTGAILHIVNDALMTLVMFLAASAVIYKVGGSRFEDFRGLYRKMPVTMAAFTLGAFSLIGVPPTCGFFSKWYLILGGIDAGQWSYVAALVVSSLVNAIIFFRIIEIAFFQKPEGEDTIRVAEAPLAILSPLVVTAIALIVVGLFTGPIVGGLIAPALPWSF